MRSLLLHPTSTAQWQALILEAQKDLSIKIEEELEAYLVFLLMRFVQQPHVTSSVLGLDFLHSLDKMQHDKPFTMKDVGDKCLLFAGLFPERAKRKRVDNLYFVKLGQTAYATLSENIPSKHAPLFSLLCTEFILLTDILQATRDMSSATHDLLEQIERWQNTGSQLSWQRIQQKSKAIPNCKPDHDDDEFVH